MAAHVPRHPRVAARAITGPTRVADHLPAGGWLTTFNTKLALTVTRLVGSMWCAYVFAVFDLLALPQALRGGVYGVVQWTASFFLQLVLLSIIMVGQNTQAAAADRRAQDTFLDVEALLDDNRRVQEYLVAQDAHLTELRTLVIDSYRRYGANYTTDERGAHVTEPVHESIVDEVKSWFSREKGAHLEAIEARVSTLEAQLAALVLATGQEVRVPVEAAAAEAVTDVATAAEQVITTPPATPAAG